MKNTLLILIVAGIAVAAGSWFASTQKTTQEEAIEAARAKFASVQGNILSPPRKIAVPELVKHDGTAFNGKDLQGQWSILFFGFTNCHMICPTAMSMLAQSKKLAEDQKVDFPQVYLVSVDPERDDPATMSKFVTGFDKDFIGITGDQESIKALSLQMSVIYMRAQSEKADESGKSSTDKGDKENYQIDHSAAMLLINPQGSLTAFLNAPHTPARILKDIQIVSEN